MSDGLGENPAVGPSGSDGLGENPAVGPSGSDGLGKNLLSASARRAPTDSGRISCREKDVVQIMFSRKPIPVPSPTIRSCIPFCEKKFFAPSPPPPLLALRGSRLGGFRRLGGPADPDWEGSAD